MTSTLINEIEVYERLGYHHGIITLFQASEYGIVPEFANQGNLESYIKTNIEPPESFKINWIFSLTETLSYVHSRKVFVDDLALRNTLIVKDKLKLADFGQSILLSSTADVNTICENDMTAQIEVFHLGWIIYSIAVWHVHKYYFFDEGNEGWPGPQALPNTANILCGDIIRKCWHREYASMDALNEDVLVPASSVRVLLSAPGAREGLQSYNIGLRRSMANNVAPGSQVVIGNGEASLGS